jgi:hypothetical protein
MFRELDGSEPGRLVRNEANVGLPASHGVDHHRGAGSRLEVERLANSLSEFAGEIKRFATHFAGVSIANSLCRIGGQIGCAQREVSTQESGIARDDPLTLAKLPNVRARHDYRRIEKFGFKPRISK